MWFFHVLTSILCFSKISPSHVLGDLLSRFLSTGAARLACRRTAVDNQAGYAQRGASDVTFLALRIFQAGDTTLYRASADPAAPLRRAPGSISSAC